MLGGVFTRKLELGVAMQLEKQFEEKEILAALKGCSTVSTSLLSRKTGTF